LKAAAFLLLAPFLATGLYDLSRMRESGERPDLISSLTAWRRNLVSIGIFAAALGVITIVWIRLSALLFAVVFIDHAAPGVGASTGEIFFTGAGLRFLIVFFLTGGCVAAFVFAISVVAVPMMLDRPVDFFTAVASSLTAVGQNIQPMLRWALLIAGITVIGLLPLFLGLAVTMPVIGHASWHAYRDLVGE
jgi:uncharacterized membrane protein